MKQVGEFCHSGTLAELRLQALSHARLRAAVVAALPEWMSADGIEVGHVEDGILQLAAAPATARLLAQLQPSLAAALAGHGVRSVRIRRLG